VYEILFYPVISTSDTWRSAAVSTLIAWVNVVSVTTSRIWICSDWSTSMNGTRGSQLVGITNTSLMSRRNDTFWRAREHHPVDSRR